MRGRSRHRKNWSAVCLLFATTAAAHDIPNDVTVQMLVKPQGEHLIVQVRVPMKAMRDLEFGPTGPLLNDVATLWISDALELNEAGTPLPRKPRVVATRIALESEPLFAFDMPQTAANVDWKQTMLDVWFDYPIHSDTDLAIRPALGRLGVNVVTALRFVTPTGAIRVFEFNGDPGLVRLDPRWHQAALRFVDLGFRHILDGTDHLLFLLCLVIPFRRFRPLLAVVTSFTVAHSITLIASAYNLAPDALWFPPLVETLIALSIVYMALENIVGGRLADRRWAIAFGFGLVHGFGFSFALREGLQFAGSHLLTSLLSFNVGVELGQLLVLVLLIPTLELVFRKVVAERMGTIILSAIVTHTGWHWMLDRWEVLRKYHITLDVPLIVSAMRWAMAAIILYGLVRFVRLRRVGFSLRGASAPPPQGHTDQA